MTSCIQPFSISISGAETQLVVDGMISTDPGPYTIKLSHPQQIPANPQHVPVVSGALMVMTSSESESDTLRESTPGAYRTQFIQGKEGVTYTLNIVLPDGKIYRSNPERIPKGVAIDSVRAAFEYGSKFENGVELPADLFNIFVDTNAGKEMENYCRWRMIGTYEIEAFPNLHTGPSVNGPVFLPLVCGGVISPRYGIEVSEECTCCHCWVTDSGPPVVTSDQLNSGRVNDQWVGSVPVNQRTFYNKYHVEVQRMAMTRESYEYWRNIQEQKEGAGSLFQPVTGRLVSNVMSISDPTEIVQGFFSAVSISRKDMFINRGDVPYRVAPIDTIRNSCLTVAHATNVKPAFWR